MTDCWGLILKWLVDALLQVVTLYTPMGSLSKCEEELLQSCFDKLSMTLIHAAVLLR